MGGALSSPEVLASSLGQSPLLPEEIDSLEPGSDSLGDNLAFACVRSASNAAVVSVEAATKNSSTRSERLGNMQQPEHRQSLAGSLCLEPSLAPQLQLPTGFSRLSTQVVASAQSREAMLCRRKTFAQRLRHQAWSSQVHSTSIGQHLPQKRKRKRQRAERTEALRRPRTIDDDDSAEEPQEYHKRVHSLKMLLTSDMNEAEQIQFTAVGCYVHFDQLQACRNQVVDLSETVAMMLAGGMDPISSIALQSGRLTSLRRAKEFQLQKSNGGWMLVADVHACFNFLLHRWQPLHMVTHGPYAPVVDLLYLAFVPQKVCGLVHGRCAFFVKLGYRELVKGEDGDNDALIGYVEKKSLPLQLTNVPGAGIFVFEAPDNHMVFARPGRAAEASLKTELLHTRELTVTPSGHRGEVGTFSASLEYFFIEESEAGIGPLEALTRMLQTFTGNTSLLPQCAVASDGGGSRRGRKHLHPWPCVLDLKAPGDVSCGDADCGRMILHDRTNLNAPTRQSPMHALRSRAKRAQLGGGLVHKIRTCNLKGARSRMTL